MTLHPAESTGCYAAPCTSTAPYVLAVACPAGHEQTVHACQRDASAAMRSNGNHPCPRCAASAGWAIYCGFCRKGAHDDCRAYAGARRVMAGGSPVLPDEYCACSCDMRRELVPGARWARGHGPVDEDGTERGDDPAA